MASILVTGFLPEEWADFAVLLDVLVGDGSGLYRWEEHFFEDGSRRRVAHIIRDIEGPTVEAIGRDAVERARARGFRTVPGDEGRTTLLDDSQGRLLRVGYEPLPRRVVLELGDLARPDLGLFPSLAPVLALTSRAAASWVRLLVRTAELDLEAEHRFFPPTTRLVLGGPYDRALLCEALEGAKFTEDGDVWTGDSPHVRFTLRLQDDVVQLSATPL
jgi:hypothetical protein